jgi:hypothetical protein
MVIKNMKKLEDSEIPTLWKLKSNGTFGSEEGRDDVLGWKSEPRSSGQTPKLYEFSVEGAAYSEKQSLLKLFICAESGMLLNPKD